MTKVRRQKKRKHFNTSINRKRLRNRLENVGNIECIPIKRAWDNNISARSNLKNMGLAYDPNEVLKIPSYKEIQKQKAIAIKNGDFNVTDEPQNKPTLPPKTRVIKDLEADAKAPRDNNIRLPKAQVDMVTYLLDKYGCDYRAMAKDRKNYYQETWKQLRAKVKRFMKSPKVYGKYLMSKGPVVKDEDDDEISKEVDAMVDDSD